MSTHTPGPWEFVPSTEHHGPYVTSAFGSTICDCYAMSHPGEQSTRNGGRSKPVLFLHEMADPNARLIAAAPEMYEALKGIAPILADIGYFDGFDPERGTPDSLGRSILRERAARTKAVYDALRKAEGRAE